MGFLDKLFGGRGLAGTDSKWAEIMKGWRTYEDKKNGFLFSYPPEWPMEESSQGLEIYPGDSSRTFDPALKREASNPRVMLIMSDVSDPNLNIVKDFIRIRSAEFVGYKFIKHHSNKISNASHAAIYEFYYGSQDNLFRALSAIAQKKNRIFIVTASGTADDYHKNENVLEHIVFSFQLT